MVISARKIQNGGVEGGALVLNVVIREGLTERVISEHRCEGGGGNGATQLSGEGCQRREQPAHRPLR